jgi:hypothetical protein
VNLQEAYNVLNFWINKYLGYYYSPPELDSIVDRGQMSLYSDLQPQYATSQRIKDALAPFRRTWDFTPTNTISGVIPIPSNLNFLNLLDARIQFDLSGVTRYVSLDLPNEDELSARLNSQIDPVTITSPIAEVVGNTNGVYYIKIYPTGLGYSGRVTFLRRPIKPVFVYTTISQRVIVYNDVASTQLEWPENWQNAVLLKALESAGINLTDREIQEFAETKTSQNFQNFNRT